MSPAGSATEPAAANDFRLRRIVRFPFTVEDLASTRFAVSPSWELVSSLRLLRDPARGGLHLSWVAHASDAVRDLPLRLALALVPPGASSPTS